MSISVEGTCQTGRLANVKVPGLDCDWEELVSGRSEGNHEFSI